MPTSGIGNIIRDKEGRHKHISLRAAYANDFNCQGTMLSMIDMLPGIFSLCPVRLCALNVLSQADGSPWSIRPWSRTSFRSRLEAVRPLGRIFTFTNRQSDTKSLKRVNYKVSIEFYFLIFSMSLEYWGATGPATTTRALLTARQAACPAFLPGRRSVGHRHPMPRNGPSCISRDHNALH